jgi:hypothetical protein
MPDMQEHLKIEGRIGRWYVVDCDTIDGNKYYLLEHETYGDEAAHLIVNDEYKVVAEDSFNSLQEDLRGHLDWRQEYYDSSINDLLGYYRIANEDVARFLDRPEVKEIKKRLIYKDMSIDDMRNIIGADHNIYPLSYKGQTTFGHIAPDRSDER